MVVVGCLTLLTFIILPGLTGAREAGKRAICLSNLKTLGAGMLLYAQDYEGKIPAWGWQFDEILSQGDPQADWINKTVNSLTKSFEYAYIWEYILSKRPFVCPSLKLLYSPKPWVGTSRHSAYVWGWPGGAGTLNPPGPMWSYQLNAQAAYSRYSYGSDGRIEPELVLPNPDTVMMLFEQDCNDYASFDNAISLFAATYSSGNDSLGAYHSGEGNMVYFDGHVGSMPRSEFLKKCSTSTGTLELIGGYQDFIWP